MANNIFSDNSDVLLEALRDLFQKSKTSPDFTGSVLRLRAIKLPHSLWMNESAENGSRINCSPSVFNYTRPFTIPHYGLHNGWTTLLRSQLGTVPFIDNVNFPKLT